MFSKRKHSFSLLLSILLISILGLFIGLSSVGAAEHPTWDANTVYLDGDIVSHEGKLWEAEWWTKNQEPGTTGQWGPWIEIGDSNTNPDDPGSEDPNDSSTSVDGFYVSNGELYDANGEPFVIRGVNYAHTWYKNDLSQAIPAIADTGANAVRIVLSNGTQYTRDSLQSVNNIINLLEQHNLVAILEVHDATGSDSVTDLNNAVNYWIDIKDALIGNEDTVIVNIANEWYGTWDGQAWAQGYEQAIPQLRDAGIKNTLIVDSAGWGQYPQSIHDYGQQVFQADSLNNTVFSIHMYEYSGGDAATVKSNIDGVIDQGLPLIIGEFGQKHSNGDVDEATIMSYSQQKSVGWLAWSWHGNSGGVEYLDLANGPSGGLTNWGNTVVHGSYGLKETSQTSSVFD